MKKADSPAGQSYGLPFLLTTSVPSHRARAAERSSPAGRSYGLPFLLMASVLSHRAQAAEPFRSAGSQQEPDRSAPLVGTR
eukprot:6950266-Heterocapsa_arctica.AAC.1